MNTPAFLSVAQTAVALGVSDDLVYDLVARDVLPAARLGRRKVIPARAVDLLVERALASFDADAVLAASSIQAAS